jgi:hypothetical protein
MEISDQGVMSRETFRKQFLDRYAIEGERYHPGKGAVVDGVLLASDRSAVVTVPIWKWKIADGTDRFLCQSSDDGSPPAFSALSHSESDLLNQIGDRLRDPG